MRKWHRVSGIIAAVFILNLSITGIILNHPDAFDFVRSEDHFSYKITHTNTHPRSPKTIWIGTEEGLYVSRDAGKTTQKVMIRYPDFPVTDIYIDSTSPDNIYVTYKNHLLVHSSDHGITWERIHLPKSLEFIFSVSKDDLGLLLTSDNGLYRFNEDTLTHVVKTGASAQFFHTVRALHSGYIFAPVLIWLHDISALILIFLTISGIAIYFRMKKR